MAIERAGVGAVRGPLRDAATVFDENGVVLVTRDQRLIDDLKARRWHDAFVVRRPAWNDVGVRSFGHALMDKLVAPYKAITAHAMAVELDADGNPRGSRPGACRTPRRRTESSRFRACAGTWHPRVVRCQPGVVVLRRYLRVSTGTRTGVDYRRDRRQRRPIGLRYCPPAMNKAGPHWRRTWRSVEPRCMDSR